MRLATVSERDSQEDSDTGVHGYDGIAMTFRDPAGRLRLTERYALRQIDAGAVEQTLEFLASPLRAALERSGDLVASEILDGREDGSGELWLRHPRIEPISYPWEWTTSQWQAAAELTLRLADQAIDAGWMLKDATPLNVVFAGGRPVLVDVLSFEPRDPQSMVWLAYGQFVRTFLLPLVAERFLSWSLQATILNRDGYEPSAIYRALRPWQRLRPDLFDVVTLATIFEAKSGVVKATPANANALPKSRDPELVTHILHKRIARLRKQVGHVSRREQSSTWSEYGGAACHYSAVAKDGKRQFVRAVLERCRPGRVLDIGANTGMYSRLAAEAGAAVVALDSDAAAVDALWRMAAQQGLDITAMLGNIARPSPAVGWRNREQLSLLERLEGKFDLVLMLAVIHHLILREQLPLEHVGDLCASLTRRWLVLEWVPPSDPMYQEWLRGREALYGGLSEHDLIRAFAPRFAVVDRTELENGRVLFLFELHHDVTSSAG